MKKNLYVQYVVMFTKEMLHQRNVQFVVLVLTNSKSRQVKENGLLSTL